MADAEVRDFKITDVLPAEVHGFTVRCVIGPYPAEAKGSHRKAMYAELTPASDHARQRMKAARQQQIIGTLPLTEKGAEAISLDPDGRAAEMAARVVLMQAAALAREVVA